MVQITYPDNSIAEYHENGDIVEITKTKYYAGGQYIQYRKGTIATITHSDPISSHPMLTFMNILSEKDGKQVGVSCTHMKSLELPRLSFTSKEAESFIFSYDENNKIKIVKK